MSKRVFVDSSFMAMLTCPYCGVFKKKDVSKFMGHKTRVTLKYKCSCKKSVSVILERRHHLRKDVHFKGRFLNNSKSYPIKVKNISKHGVRILLSEILPLEIGQRITIEFTLDDPNKSIVIRDVRVKNIISSVTFVCEFISADHHGNLGKYFLFYF
jgi:hypothetical protein